MYSMTISSLKKKKKEKKVMRAQARTLRGSGGSDEPPTFW